MFAEIYFIIFSAFLVVARILNLLQVPTGCVWQLLNPIFGEICLILGFSGRERILNLFRVPPRFVWQLSNSVFGVMCFV